MRSRYLSWKYIALTATSLTTALLVQEKKQQKKIAVYIQYIPERILSSFVIHAAQYRRKYPKVENGENEFNDENEDDKSEKDDNEKNSTSQRERRFLEFASVEYNGNPYMTPMDFLESVVTEKPRPRVGRRHLDQQKVDALLYNTPPKHRGSKKFFRNLEESGIISFPEYLFLWVILTKPSNQFEIAFNMFDTDGNQVVDKQEFLVLTTLVQRLYNPSKSKSDKSLSKTNTKSEDADTTLLLHFFGRNGRDTLNYAEFKRFMEHVQTEILEIEFNEFSHGFKTISEVDFVEILLRYTNFNHDEKRSAIKTVKRSIQSSGVTFDQFKHFSLFLNNLQEFNIAMRFHQLSNKPISQPEFQRAVRISTGLELERNIVELIFKVFDADNDQHLSYDEFIAVMKDRLQRGFQSSNARETPETKFDQFKRCVRERANSSSRNELYSSDNRSQSQPTINIIPDSSVLQRESEISYSSSTSSSSLNDENVTADKNGEKKHAKKKSETYDKIANYLLKNRFYLTALEYYTELLENGYDLPRLRDYFSNPANFEGTSTTKQAASSYNRPFGGDSISLGGGGGNGGLSFHRASSNHTFDSSIDNITRYSEDVDWNNGNNNEYKISDERVAVLEFELRKARDTIQELRNTLTYETEQTNNDNHDEEKMRRKRNTIIKTEHVENNDLNTMYDQNDKKNSITTIKKHSLQQSLSQTSSIHPYERRALNFLINDYLLTNNYKMSSVTLAEENGTQDLDDWDSVGINRPRPPDLLQLYRLYYHELNESNVKKMEDFGMMINFDGNLIEENKRLENDMALILTNLEQTKKRMERIEKEKEDIENDIENLCKEKNNILVQLQVLQNRSSVMTDNDNEIDTASKHIEMEKTTFSCKRNLPSAYRRAFERLWPHINSTTNNTTIEHVKDEDKKSNQEYDEQYQHTTSHILNELQGLSLITDSIVCLITQTVLHIIPNLNGSKRLDLVPLIVYASILHNHANERDNLLRTLFNLIKKPTSEQREVLLCACICFAKQVGPLRVNSELLPQCWEQLTHKCDERRALVAESCGVLAPYLPADIRCSLIFSMLQQLLADDKCDEVRCACCKSLAMVINYIDDETKLVQCIDLLDRCLNDTTDVVRCAKQYLLPSIAVWCLELKKLYDVLLEHYVVKLETLVQNITPSTLDAQRFIQYIYILNDLCVFIFAASLISLNYNHETIPDIGIQKTQQFRFPVNSSEFYDIHVILSPNSQHLLDYYSYCCEHGEFPFTDNITDYLNNFLKRIFNAMTHIDVNNSKLVHACSEHIKCLGQYFGRNFWKLKIKPIYFSDLSNNENDQRVVTVDSTTSNQQSPLFSSYSKATFVLYATGVLCCWSTEQERAELTQYIYDALLVVSKQNLLLNGLQAIYLELGSDVQFQDSLLNVLRDSLTNANSQVRLCTLQLFHAALQHNDRSTLSSKILPALITLASDDDVTVRIATIAVFGSIIVHCSELDILERVYSQFQMFDSDPKFRDEYHTHVEMIKTFTHIAPHVESKFQEDFILPYLAATASQNNQQQRETKRLETAIYLFEAYSALSCCFHSVESLQNSFLPGLYCLRSDFAQLRPDHVAVIDSITKDLENKLELNRPDGSTLIGNFSSTFNQENLRGRMLNQFSNLRDSTARITRFMKKK